MKKLRFSKMQGAGNDFVVLDGVRQNIDLSRAQLRFLANRHFGVGADQILLVEASTDAACDFVYRIFNADGGEVEQCGNGARCFARFVVDAGLTQKREIAVRTQSGIIAPRLEDDGLVSVNMGAPRFAHAHIPFVANRVGSFTLETVDWRSGKAVSSNNALKAYRLPFRDDFAPEVFPMSMGNPHAVQLFDTMPDMATIAHHGSLIETSPYFPNRVNVGFMVIKSRHEIDLRVWERGAGNTLACGTGACAAVVAGIAHHLLDEHVCVHMRGGDVWVSWQKPADIEVEMNEGEAAEFAAYADVWLKGEATLVFEGEIELSEDAD